MGKPKKLNARKKNRNKDGYKINKSKLQEGADFISFKKPLNVPKDTDTTPEVQNVEHKTDYPILKDTILQKEFLSVSMNNNQKGRIRQLLRDSLIGPTPEQLPDIINSKIQAVLCNEARAPPALRKIRLLFNMLKTAIENKEKFLKDKGGKGDGKKEVKSGDNKVNEDKEVKSEDKDDIVKEDIDDSKEDKDNEEGAEENKKDIDKDDEVIEGDKQEDVGEDEAMKDGTETVEGNKKEELKKDEKDVKKKGPKRYVAFVGNLPIDIDKETLESHFKDLSSSIKDIRIPKVKKDKKSAYAYLEMNDEQSYEMALSKNHSMLNNRRINVQYSTQQNSKITKSEAKGKVAKMVALQKSGKLIGSIPINRKRSNRRKKQRDALAKLAAESNK